MFRSLTMLLFFFSAVVAAAQTADTATVADAVRHLRQAYYQEKYSESFIALGSDYADYQPIEDEHPFFLEDDWIFGRVHYNGITYDNVPLQFDIRSGKILTEHPASGKKIELVKENVQWFSLNNHRFLHLAFPPDPGFYELLATGRVKLWAAHSKTFQESVVTGKVTVRTEENTRYFIEKDHLFIPVKNKRSLLNALAIRKEFQQELKKNRINFHQDKRTALLQAVTLYNSLR